MARTIWRVLLSALSFANAATLYNGSQALHYPSAETQCLAAFNTSIDCDDTLVQLLPFSLSTVGWNTSQMTTLCTTNCKNDLADLATEVENACGDATFTFDGTNMTFTNVVDLYQYKYGLVCLTDSDTGSFCIDVEASWDIAELESSGTSTWPMYTNKTYPNCQNADWESDEDTQDGDPYMATDYVYPTDLPKTPIDYLAGDIGITSADLSYGWAESLEYDEHPLEIQCSPCFLDRLRYGVASKWGEVYDEITMQVWANIQMNCNLTDELNPAINMTGVGYNATIPEMADYTDCPQNITIDWVLGDAFTTCNAAALSYDVPSASLRHMNQAINCAALSGIFCAPQSCNVTRVNTTTTLQEFVEGYANITMTQMTTWNPHIQTFHLEEGEVICMGPPGGVYIPATTAAAVPSVYTTTDTPTYPTPSGTYSPCGLYYEVVSGDYCELIAIRYSLTFSQLVGLNPSLDTNCTNLEIGYDYCVAVVNGSSIPVATTTLTPSVTVSSSTRTVPTTTVAAPTSTVSGTTTKCYEWHTVESGDTCQAIDAEYDITFAYFQSLNTYIDDDCSNIWVGYSYCVDGIPVSSASSTYGTQSSSGSGSSSTTATSQPSSTAIVSPDGTCSGDKGYTCQNSAFGDCCSEYGNCGSSTDYCGSGCQSAYGSCDETQTVSPDGTCGDNTEGYTCEGSSFGSCCSEYGYCGSSADFCGTGCQSTYGTCS